MDKEDSEPELNSDTGSKYSCRSCYQGQPLACGRLVLTSLRARPTSLVRENESQVGRRPAFLFPIHNPANRSSPKQSQFLPVVSSRTHELDTSNCRRRTLNL